jgi:biotin carboxyl carrier protein
MPRTTRRRDDTARRAAALHREAASLYVPRVRYYVTLDPDPAKPPVLVDVVELPSGALSVHVDGKVVDVDVLPLREHLSVRVAGKVVDLTVEGVPPDVGAVASGHRSYVRVESERMRSADQAKKGTREGSEKLVKSPMPGRVVKILVKKGDAIEAGQALMVVEAMKMENEIRAKAAGTVADVHVEVGATVEGNAKLVSLS